MAKKETLEQKKARITREGGIRVETPELARTAQAVRALAIGGLQAFRCEVRINGKRDDTIIMMAKDAKQAKQRLLVNRSVTHVGNIQSVPRTTPVLSF